MGKYSQNTPAFLFNSYIHIEWYRVTDLGVKYIIHLRVFVYCFGSLNSYCISVDRSTTNEPIITVITVFNIICEMLCFRRIFKHFWSKIEWCSTKKWNNKNNESTSLNGISTSLNKYQMEIKISSMKSKLLEFILIFINWSVSVKSPSSHSILRLLNHSIKKCVSSWLSPVITLSTIGSILLEWSVGKEWRRLHVTLSTLCVCSPSSHCKSVDRTH